MFRWKFVWKHILKDIIGHTVLFEREIIQNYL